MGCESSQLVKQTNEIRISIVDSSFMKPENDSIRKQMNDANILYDLFISMECFFDEFANRYYNKVVVSYDNFPELNTRLRKLKYSPNIYVILDNKKLEENLRFNVIAVENYNDLIRCLQQKKNNSNSEKNNEKVKTKKNCYVKVLCKPGPRTSEETIFEAALKKSNIQYQFYNSFQVLEQSLDECQSQYIVTSYIYHKQVLELVKNKKTKVICYCSFDKSESYDAELYSVSNNYLEITTDIKSQIVMKNKPVVRCTKAYVYTNELQDYEEICNVIEDFNIEMRAFVNIDTMIKQTTYFFCVTILAAESQVRKLKKAFESYGFSFRVKIIGVSNKSEPKIDNLYKTIRQIKKGYYTERSVTYSIDIIDKHYNNVKFEEIKKELEKNEIACFGYGNLSTYIKHKKFISSFIICNYEERILLVKYLKQLQSKAKVIIFCNKNKIDSQLKFNNSFAFVSSHFGKIIKFIKKTPVFVPILPKPDEKEIDEKIQSIKNKNRRISALKWSGIQNSKNGDQSQQNFQFLNISKTTNNGSVRDILKSVSSLWKTQSSVTNSLQNFRVDFVKSLKQLLKIYKISYSSNILDELLEQIKKYSFDELLAKNKDFFEAENQLGLAINNSLISTQVCDRNQIISMREFLMISFMNYFSGFSIPNIGIKKLKRWVSHGLIEKCEKGSYLFCKNFLIFYEQDPLVAEVLTPYKIQLQIEFNSLVENDIYLNNYITNKDKFIFSPFSQFQVLDIRNCGQFKTIVLKYIKNVDFLKFIYQLNVIDSQKNISSFVQEIRKNPSKADFLDNENRERVLENLDRCYSLQLFKIGKLDEAIQIHKDLRKKAEEQENLNSSLVNQLTFELACYYLKNGDPNSSASLLKQLMESDPGEFIRGQCQKLIGELTKEEPQNSEQPSAKVIPEKSYKNISDEAMKTFIWLKNKEEQSSSQDEDDAELDQNIENLEIAQPETDFKCLQIDQFDGQGEFGQDITNTVK